MRSHTPRCIHCQSRQHVVLGDGRPVCSPCILRLGAVAGKPLLADTFELEALRAMHADVVTLDTVKSHLSWTWVDTWPVK